MWGIYQACRAQLEFHQAEVPHKLQTNVMYRVVLSRDGCRLPTLAVSSVPKIEPMLAITCMMHNVWSSCITCAATSQTSPQLVGKLSIFKVTIRHYIMYFKLEESAIQCFNDQAAEFEA
jgi:hypothetical protein